MPEAGSSYVFLGTPNAAAVVLDHLVQNGITIAHVVTRPDAKRGRGSALSPSPVKEVALRHGIEVSHDLEWIRRHRSNNLMGLVVAYGRIIPADLLDDVPMVNIHFSLLPRWRGAAPVERALLAGDDKTGVCVMQIEPTLDTGPVFARREVEITDQSTTASLTEELAQVGAQLLLDCLRNGLGSAAPQTGEATHAAKIMRDELRIDWTRPAVFIHRQVRAVRAFAELNGSRVRIVAARVGEVNPDGGPGVLLRDGTVSTGDGTLVLTRVQPEGRAEMDAAAWLRGLPADASLVFG